jgi:putative membrane protein
MGWYGHGMSAWGWVATAVCLILVLGLLTMGGALLVRLGRRASDGSSAQRPSLPEQLLAERFARGEIDTEEYQQRRATLRGAGTGGGAP